MRILVESFCETESGPVLAHDIAVGLKNNGIDVYCVITNKMENCNNWIRDIGEAKVFLWDGTPSKKNPINMLTNTLKMMNYFRSKKFDFVLITNPAKIDIWVSKYIQYQENIMILHDAIPHSSTDKGLNDYVHNVVSKADNILVMSKLFIDTVHRKYNKNINNILYMRHGLMKYPVYNGDHDVKYCNSKINFLYFGRIDGYKGLHILAAAYDLLSRKYQDITLTVAGGGDFTEYEEEYRKLERVEVLNKYILDSEIAEIFSRPNTVLVLPYLDATQSGVIGTGFNYLTPIIASDTGGIREQLFDGAVGRLVHPGDISSLVSEMEKFIIDPTIYSVQLKLMEEYKEKMTWDYITNELIDDLRRHI